MKLSEQQIQYINNYLQRSGLKYWDVRMEILDHIVVAVEEKMQQSDALFKEALIEVVDGFGNKTKKRYVLNKDNTQWILAGMFSDGVGFRKLQEEKQKQIGKKYSKIYWNTFLNQFKSILFYLQFMVYILSLCILYQYSPKLATFAAFILLFLPLVWLIFDSLIKEFTRNSLHLQMVLWTFLIYTTSFSLITNGYNMFFDEKMKFIWMISILIFLFPFVRISLLRYREVHQTIKKYYQLTLKA